MADYTHGKRHRIPDVQARTACGLPVLPMLDETVLVRTAPRPYTEVILPGMIFAWEPDLPHARCLLIVTKITGPQPTFEIKHGRGTAVISSRHDHLIWSKYFPTREYEVWNDESRFREAVIPTRFKPQTS
jgi:hypothetical protein